MIKSGVILSEHSESKDLRTEILHSVNDNAKILRLHFVALRMTCLLVCAFFSLADESR